MGKLVHLGEFGKFLCEKKLVFFFAGLLRTFMMLYCAVNHHERLRFPHQATLLSCFKIIPIHETLIIEAEYYH